MERFVEKYREDVTGILSGWDRLVFRGTARGLAVAKRMEGYLNYVGVLLKDWGTFVEEKSQRLKKASLAAAREQGRPVRYLWSSKTSKEDVARTIAQRDRIGEGLICVLTCVEPCRSYEVYRNRQTRMLELQPRWRKCLFLYHYWMDPVFGFMNARIQTWFPFSIQVCTNGRERLGRQMDRVGLRYERCDNCFPWIEDVPKAQALMDGQLRTNWPAALNAIARRLNPIHDELFAPAQVDYYWTVYQSEWATDIMFRTPEALAAFYPKLIRAGISIFGSDDVMRFLGKKANGNFRGEVKSSYRKRSEGMRIKHWYKDNSIKAYDKFGRLLRLEPTINTPRDFRVYRPKEGDPHGQRTWRPMRKGVADLHRRAEVSQAAVNRYADALASLETPMLVQELVEPVCQPTRWKHRRIRALHPWSPDDYALLQIVSRGEFTLNGFRNRDLVEHLFPGRHDPQTQQRLSARITRSLRMLRAHGLIRKVPRTYRYVLSSKGREITTAILQTYHIPVAKLTEMAA